MKTTGIFWHVHHDKLLEYCYNYRERVDFIKNQKPANEVKTRLRLFRPVKGKLPIEMVRTIKAYNKACKAFNKARKPFCKAREPFYKACEAFNKACESYKAEIEDLHVKECPNCSWDGKEIVF